MTRREPLFEEGQGIASLIHMCGDDGVPVTAGDENKEHMNTLTTYGAALHDGILGAKLEYVCAWCCL